MTDDKQQSVKPAFAEVNSALRTSWAQKCTVTNPVAATRDIAPFIHRLRSAAHVATFGPMLAGHQHCNAVMWDANTFSGHDVAFEAAELIYSVLERCLSAFSNHELELLNRSSAARRSYYYDNSPRPTPANSDDFTNDSKQQAVATRTGAMIERGGGTDFILRYDPRTGRLLCVVVPFDMGFDDLCRRLTNERRQLRGQLHTFDGSDLSKLPYAETLRAVINSSVADVDSLLTHDIGEIQRFFSVKENG